MEQPARARTIFEGPTRFLKITLEKKDGIVRVPLRDMKNNSLAVLLVGILGLSVVATAALSFTYVRSTRKLLFLSAHADRIKQSLAIMRSLASDSVEYSKREPAMEPILESVGIKLRNDAGASVPSATPNLPQKSKAQAR
jgi:hypothetical protein